MNKPMFLKTASHFALLISASALISACQTTGTPGNTASSSSGFDHMSRLDSALARAAHSASASGNSGQSLAILEKIYTRNSEDEKAAVEYAAALRDAGHLTQANMVLAPFANGASSSSLALSEYAALKIEMGEYESAQEYAQKAIKQDATNGEAHQYLGIALDAQEKYPEGEQAFRKALEHWSGDPTAVMNNLALNLAAQGYFEEAFTILERAKALSPYKIEVERNLRIVRALQQTEGGWVPKPKARPKPATAPMTKPDVPEKAVQDEDLDAPGAPSEDAASEDTPAEPATSYDMNAALDAPETVEPAAGNETPETLQIQELTPTPRAPISLLDLTYND